VEAALPRLHGPFDLVLLDPPYADGAKFTATVDGLARVADQLLGEASVVITEQAAATALPEAIGPLPLRTTRTHGRTKIALYAKEPPGDPQAD
jgi:16S rRNA (guanine966-N2)-methyltransferase